MTVSELKERMSQDELNTWVAYVDENGPLNQSLRLEAAVARAISPFLKNTKPRDLMVWPREPEEPASLKDVFGVLLTASKSRKRKN
jgi:hypothetical protein